jgi:hypothetical protein
MAFFQFYRFGFLLALLLSLWTVAGHAQEPRYRYVSLDQVVLPPGFTSFSPSAIQESGRVYGTLCDSTCSVTAAALGRGFEG